MKRVMFITVLLLSVLFVGAVFAETSYSSLPSYMVDGILGIESENDVLVDGVAATETFEKEGKILWNGGAPEDGSTVRITDGFVIVDVTVYDLLPSEVYSDTNGVELKTNLEEWGRAGVVVYPPEGGRIQYNLTGWGYELQYPDDTLFWNPDPGAWTPEPVYGYYTNITVPEPDPPSILFYLPFLIKG